jgi:hypothetical protein
MRRCCSGCAGMAGRDRAVPCGAPAVPAPPHPVAADAHLSYKPLESPDSLERDFMKGLAIILLVLPLFALAQPVEIGTWDVEHQEITVEGKLEGCSLVFTALTVDHAYLGGKQVVLNGSIALRTLERKDLFFVGKLGTRQWTPSGPGLWERPVHFHFFSKTGSTAGRVQVMDAETPGYRLLLGRATDDRILALITEMADASEFGVGFNRKTGGQDVRAQIKMNVRLRPDNNGGATRVISNETPAAYATCVSRVINDLRQQLGSK